MIDSARVKNSVRNFCTVAVLAAAMTILSFEDSALGQSKSDDAMSSPPRTTQRNATPAKCGGHDLVAELKTTNPEIYQRVISDGGKVANANAVLWKLTKPGLEPSYLLGTMHVSDPRMTTFSEKVKAALASAKTIALEIADLSPQAMGRAISQNPKLIFYFDGTTLNRKLTAQEFAVAQDVLIAAGLPAQATALVKPWFVYLMMAVPACEVARVKTGKLVLDAKLARYGKDHDILVVGLETAMQQMEIIAGMPEKDQVELVKFSIAYDDQRENMFETMIQLYLERQLGLVVPLSVALSELRALKIDGMDRFMKTVVVQRNHGMRDKALPLLEKGGAFIAVGALHLVGDEGLVALFRKAGYTVTAVD
jgi:uncharacterized protein YbaP (TraB family)